MSSDFKFLRIEGLRSGERIAVIRIRGEEQRWNRASLETRLNNFAKYGRDPGETVLAIGKIDGVLVKDGNVQYEKGPAITPTKEQEAA